MNKPIKLRNLLMIIISSLFVISLNAQVFQKNYSLTTGYFPVSYNFTESVQQTNDGGFIFQGWNQSAFSKMELVKTDNQGVITWKKEYSKCLIYALGNCYQDDLSSSTVGGCVQQTSDGGYILCGSLNSNMILIKTTYDGTVSWSKTYGSNTYGKYVRQMSDGSYICVGYSGNNVYIVKTNSSGVLQWERAYQIGNYGDEATDVDQINNGQIVVTGYTTSIYNPGASADTTTDVFILRFDQTGGILSANTYGLDDQSEDGQSIRKTTDGGYVVSGSTSQTNSSSASDVFLWKFNAAGVNEFQYNYKLGGVLSLDINFGYAAQQTADGGYALFGVITSLNLTSFSFFSNFLIKLDNNGAAIFGKSYKDSVSGGAPFSLGYTIWNDGKQMTNGGYIIGGSGIPMSAGTGLGFKLIKTNNVGESGCSETNLYPVRYSQPFAAENLSLSNLASGTSAVSVNLSVNTPSILEEIVCNVICAARPGNDTTICQGTAPFILGQNPAAINGTGPYTYLWSPVTGLSDPTLEHPLYTPTTSVTYTLTIHDNAGCSSSKDIKITVAPKPTANAGINQNVCQGATTTSLTATSTPAGSTYLWNNSAGSTATVTVSPPITTTYTVTVTDPFNCGTASSSVVVNVLPLPVITVHPDTICKGSTYTVAATITNYASVSWSSSGTGNFNSPNAVNPIYTPSPADNIAGNVVLTVTVTGNAPCGNSVGQIALAIIQPPAPSISSPLSICLNAAPMTLTGTPAGGTFSGSGVSGNQFLPSAAGVGAHIVTYTINDAHSCSNNTTVSITVWPLPTADAGTPQTICQGTSASLTATGLPGSTYTWNNGAGNTANVTVSPGISTTYTVSVVDANSCGTATDNVAVNVSPLPVITTHPDTICKGSTYLIVATINYSSSVLWTSSGTGHFNDSTLVNPIYTPSLADNNLGNVTLTAAATSACGTSTGVILLALVQPLPPTLTNADTSICINAPLFLLTGLPVGGTFSGVGISGNQFNPLTAGAGSHAITYTISDSHGCTNFSKDTITVWPLPTANAGTDQTICNGTSATLTATGLPGSNYQWDHNAGNTATVIVSPTTTTTYTVSVSDSRSCGTATDIVIVHVNDLPVITALSDSICKGNTYQTSISVTNYTSLIWSTSGSGTFSNPALLNPIYTPSQSDVTAGSVSLTVTATGNLPCGNVNASITLHILPLPTIIFTDSLPPVCLNHTPVTLTGATPAGGTYSGTGVSNNVFNPIVAGSGQHNITYTYTDVYGCTNSDVSTIKVNPLPIITLPAFGNLCVTESPITLTGGSPQGGTYSGNFVVNGVFNPSNAGVGQHIIKYVFTDTFGCTDTATGSILVVPGISLTSNTNSVYVDLGQIVNFTTTPANQGNYVYFVDTIQKQTGSSNLFATNILESSNTVYVVLNNACSDSLKINVKPVPNAFIPFITDGKNDLFMPNVDLTILNRWGQELYKGNAGWNGKYKEQNVSPGTHFYLIKVTGLDGEVKTFTGSVTLVNK